MWYVTGFDFRSAFALTDVLKMDASIGMCSDSKECTLIALANSTMLTREPCFRFPDTNWIGIGVGDDDVLNCDRLALKTGILSIYVRTVTSIMLAGESQDSKRSCYSDGTLGASCAVLVCCFEYKPLTAVVYVNVQRGQGSQW
jgi:hypothetical protein